MTPELAMLCKRYCGAVAVSWYRSEYTLNAIQMLLDAGVKTNIHYVLGKNSIDEALERLENNDFPAGINAVIFLLHKPAGQGSQTNVLDFRDPRVAHFFAQVDKRHPFKVGMDSCNVPGAIHFCKSVLPESLDTCEGGRYSCYIGADMVMVPCSFDQQKRYDVQLSKEATIEDAWNSEPFAHLSYMNVLGKIFAETGFTKTEREPFRKAIEERGGTLADGMPLDTYCLIVNPSCPQKTEKYENAVGYGYYILTPEMFWKLLERPQKSIEHPTENDVQITLSTHYAQPQRILMDVPADTVSLDLSKFPIDYVNDHAFSSCTKLKEITLADFQINCDFWNCPLDRIISAKPATLRRKMFRNGILPELQMPLGVPDDYVFVDSTFIACARFIREYYAKSEEAMRVKPTYDAYLKKDKKKALASDDCLVIGRYMLEELEEKILSDGDLAVLRMRALKAGDEAFAERLADTQGNPELKDSEWLIKAAKGKVVIRKYKGHETEIAVPTTMKGLPVTGIEADAFSPEAPGLTDKMRASRRKLKLVILPQFLESLDPDAFRNCQELDRIVYPDGFPEDQRIQK